MNTLLKFSELKLQEWIEEIKLHYQQMLQVDLPLMKNQILTEPEVCSILGVSDRTMRTYRQRKYFHYIKLDGRILYIRWIFLLDLLSHNLQENKNDDHGSLNKTIKELLLMVMIFCF